MLLNFQVDVGPQSRQSYQLQYGGKVTRAPAQDAVDVVQEGDVVTLDTGPLRLRLSGEAGLQCQVWLEGQHMLDADGQSGFLLEDPQGTRYST